MSSRSSVDNADTLLSDLYRTQHALLLEKILPTNATAEYGLRYQFDQIDSFNEFRSRLPLVCFEDIRTDIEKMVLGEKNILTTERVLAFFKTSGSMTEPKLIPVTASLMREKISAFGQFWENIYTDYPALREGKLVSNFSDTGTPERLPSRIEVCSEASFWGRRGHVINSRARWPLPKEIRSIDNPDYRTYATARLLLQSDLHGIMCLNPSTLLQLCRSLEQNLPDLLNGLKNGNWGRKDTEFLAAVSAPLSAALEEQLVCDEHTAERLSALLNASEPLRLQQLWPMLELAICWSSNIVAPYLRQLRPYLRGIALRDYISQSSECMMAIPFTDFGSGGTLAYQSHFYEFIPEQEWEKATPDTLFAWEIEPGCRYELVATTGGGLYRYRTGDCIQVHEFKDGIPVIEFLYRLGKNSSITGEKLTEFQIMEAAQRASSTLSDQPEEFLCYPCSGETPHYALLFDAGKKLDELNRASEHMRARLWAEEFDRQLASINSEYADKCRSGRLGALRFAAVNSGALASLRQSRKRADVSAEQLKEEVLVSRLDVHMELGISELPI